MRIQLHQFKLGDKKVFGGYRKDEWLKYWNIDVNIQHMVNIVLIDQLTWLKRVTLLTNCIVVKKQ